MRVQDVIGKSVFLIALFQTVSIFAQRVAPGVPPQHYQQPQQVPVQQYQQQQHPNQQQYQQQPQQGVHVVPGVAPQHYQPQAQFQQVPVQQQQHQQPMQQQPMQQQSMHQQPMQQQPVQQQAQHHGHHAPHGQPQQVLNAANIEHERAHIQEHMQVPIDTSKMSEAELQFHYFKMHDSDNNNKLDGCELIKSLIHWHVDKPDGQSGGEHKESAVYTDQSLSDIIDYVLKTMDFNNDGYVDYAEYRKGEENAEKDKQKN